MPCERVSKGLSLGAIQGLPLTLFAMLVLSTSTFAQGEGGLVCGGQSSKPHWIMRFEITDKETHTPIKFATINIISQPHRRKLSWRADENGVGVLIITDPKCIPASGNLEITADGYKFNTRVIEQFKFIQHENEKSITFDDERSKTTTMDVEKLVDSVKDQKYFLQESSQGNPGFFDFFIEMEWLNRSSMPTQKNKKKSSFVQRLQFRRVGFSRSLQWWIQEFFLSRHELKKFALATTIDQCSRAFSVIDKFPNPLILRKEEMSKINFSIGMDSEIVQIGIACYVSPSSGIEQRNKAKKVRPLFVFALEFEDGDRGRNEFVQKMENLDGFQKRKFRKSITLIRGQFLVRLFFGCVTKSCYRNNAEMLARYVSRVAPEKIYVGIQDMNIEHFRLLMKRLEEGNLK